MSPPSSPLLSFQAQKFLTAVSCTAVILLVCALARRRLGAYEEAQRVRERLVYRVLANVSVGLDRMEEGLDELAERTAMVKAKLDRLIAARKRGLYAWAEFRERVQRGLSPRKGIGVSTTGVTGKTERTFSKA